jgi:4-hydroxybenzoate polyprenyltransferase
MVTSQYLRWAASYMSIAQWVMRFAIVATAVTFLFLKRSEQVAVLALGVVWILYNLPFFSRERIKFGLRYIWFLKPLVVGFIITGIAAIVPYQDNSPYYTAEFVPVVFILFCFVSSLVVVFEIKDRSSDAAFGTQTIATKAGVRGTKIGAIALLLVAVLAFLGSHLSMSDRGLLRYVSPFLLLILFILLFIDAHTNEYVYWVVIDGWMIYLGIYWYLLNHHIIHY